MEALPTIAFIIIIYVIILNKNIREGINKKMAYKPFKYDNYDKDYKEYSECLSNNEFPIKYLEKEKFFIKKDLEVFERKYNEHLNSIDFLATYLTIAIAIAAATTSLAVSISNIDQEISTFDRILTIKEQASTIKEQASIILDQEQASTIHDQISTISNQALIIIDQAEVISDQAQGLVILDQVHAETISDQALEISNEASEMQNDTLKILENLPKTVEQDNNPTTKDQVSTIYDQVSTICDQASIINKQAFAISHQEDNSNRLKKIAGFILDITFVPLIVIVIMMIKLYVRNSNLSKIEKTLAPKELKLLLIDKEIIRKKKLEEEPKEEPKN